MAWLMKQKGKLQQKDPHFRVDGGVGGGLSANSHVGSREFLLGRSGAAAALPLSSPCSAKSPPEKLIISTLRKFFLGSFL